MSNINLDQIEHTASLARLKLTESEKQKFTQEIGEILNYVDELNKAPIENVAPISQIADLKNVSREDVVANGDMREKLLANAPETQDGFIKVKKVFG